MGNWGRFCFPFSTTTALLLRLRLSGLYLPLVVMALPIASLSTVLRHLSLGLHLLLLLVPAATLTSVVQFPSIVVASGSCVAQSSLAFVLNLAARMLIEAAVACVARVVRRGRGWIVYLSSLNSIVRRLRVLDSDILAGRCRCYARGRIVCLRSLNSSVLDRDIV